MSKMVGLHSGLSVWSTLLQHQRMISSSERQNLRPRPTDSEAGWNKILR